MNQKNLPISETVAEFLSKVVLHPFVKDHFVNMFKIYFRLKTVGAENIP